MNSLKRSLLLIYLVLVTNHGVAESQNWRFLYSNHLHDAFISEEFESVQNNYIDVWVLINLKSETRLTDGSRSILTKRRYDCFNKRYSIYIFKSYSEYFGKGKMITELADQMVWKNYEPNSDAERIINIVCKNSNLKKANKNA